MFIVTVLLVIAILLLIYFVLDSQTLREQLQPFKAENQALRTQIDKYAADNQQLRQQMQQAVQEELERWRNKEIASVKAQQLEIAQREARTQLEQWKLDQEKLIRSDAVQRSRATITGQVTEQLAPYMSNFPMAFNPKDMRFIGSPIDFIVFCGLEVDNIDFIVFLEIKTGKSSLTKRQRQIRDAIENHKVIWQEVQLNPTPI